MEDNKILDLYFDRNEEAIKETDKKYGRYCLKISLNIVGDEEDGKECVNDTFLKAWNSIPPTRPDKFNLFLGRITRNLSIDLLKAKNAFKRGGTQIPLVLDEIAELVPDDKDVEAEYLSKEFIMSINAFLSSLEKRDSAIFVRRYFYMEDVLEIAHALDVKEGTVKSTLFRVRSKLKAYLETEGYSVGK